MMGHDIRPQDDTMIQCHNSPDPPVSSQCQQDMSFFTQYKDCDANLLSVFPIENSHSIKSNDSELHKARIVLKARVKFEGLK